MAASGKGEEDTTAAAARKVLENWVSRVPADADEIEKGGKFDAIFVRRLEVLYIRAGYALCSFTVPRHLTGVDGNWQPGAIASLIDIVGAAVIFSSIGKLDISVDFAISYFSPAKAEEAVEIEAEVVGHQGLVSCVEVAIRKQGVLVALGKQWMSSNRPSQSKL